MAHEKDYLGRAGELATEILDHAKEHGVPVQNVVFALLTTACMTAVGIGISEEEWVGLAATVRQEVLGIAGNLDPDLGRLLTKRDAEVRKRKDDPEGWHDRGMN